MSERTEDKPRRISDAALEKAIFQLLEARAAGATICPSDVARTLDSQGDWRALMPRIREVAKALVQQGRLRVTRGGKSVDATGGGGPIRLGRPGPT